MVDNFKFIRPQEAPTFQPTEEEFADPLGYINKIRPVAEKYGICKIRPPAHWAPPFAVDVDKFKFTPRIQKINELEAITRIKLNFLDEISKFWELQGIPLKIPVIGNKALDMYTLHGLVNSNDFKNKSYSEEKKWNMIAGRMGLQSTSKIKIGTQLKAHYDKILYPYDVWRSNQGKKKADVPKKANTVKGRMGGKPKMKTERLDPLANYICQNCKGGDVEEKMLLCDGCDDSYHTFCLNPPLDDVPKGEWRCPDCLEEKLNRPNDGFGFEQAQKEYTLQQFGEMADDYKSFYFKKPVHMVPTEMVEKEFWRIVSAIDEDVTVEYGADLHTMDHGSGFPTVSNSQNDSDEMYTNSGWNLNNLPVLKGSVFAHINADISGMKIPWMYVGMCFSTFCWHNEDHWSYSINYLHWGEPKTWYGVPGGRADDFENAMKSAAPELFAQAPDLLHQLVTIMNPNILMKANVPVYRMDQNAGEFIITFPRAYHAGFNQGYNFAEAVNFAPADWVQVGRECVLHYSKLNRFCVFSHDELVCAMASQPKKLEMSIAVATYKDIVKMFEQEKEQRKAVFKWGVKESEKVEFEHLADDGRQCYVCKTTLFLSAIACIHSKGSSSKDSKLVCLKHYDQYGCKECKKDGEKHILKYRYTIDDLQEMIVALKNRTGSYSYWVEKVTDALAVKEQKLTLEELREFVDEARKHDYPQTELLITATKVMNEADIVCRFARDIIGTPAVRTRKCGSTEFRFKCTINELKILSNQISYLRVIIPEKQHCANLYHKAIEIQNQTSDLLLDPNATIDDMTVCIQEATSLDVGFDEIYKLRRKCERLKWLRLATSDDDSVWTMDYLRRIIEDGNEVQRDEEAEIKMEQLCHLWERAYVWEEEAAKIISFKNDEKYELDTVKELVDKADAIPVTLPSLQNLRDIIAKATSWLEKVKNFQPPNEPFLDDLISLVDTGASLPIHLEHLKPLQTQIDAANFWRENCMRVFLKRNSTIELIEALVPRIEIPLIPQRGKKRRLVMEGPPLTFIANLLGIPHPDVKNEKALTDAYARNVVQEINSMKALRKANREKLNPDQIEDARFCVCQKPMEGFLIRCELCLEWYHPTCVPLPKIPDENPLVEAVDDGIDSQAVIAYKIAYRETKYLGPCCARSRRPDYHVILELLIGLNKIPLRMIEGVALQCLTDRAMKWQEDWDKLLQIPEVDAAVKLVGKHFTPVITTPIKKSDKDRDSDSESFPPSQKIFFDPGLRSISSPGPSSCPDSPSDTIKTNSVNDSPVDAIAVRPDKEVDIAMILAGMGDKEVIHSTVSNSTAKTPEVNGLAQSQLQNGLLEGMTNGLEQDNVPKLKLSPETLEQIENLLIEADLMEVSADEKDILWKVYDLANPTVTETRDLNDIQHIIQIEIETKGLSWDRRQTTKKRKSSLHEEKKNKSPKKSKASVENAAKRLQQESLECDEDCAADKCKQPTGQEVLWIQCDGCDQWFHLKCVGLKKRQAKTLDNYTCRNCDPKKPKMSDDDDLSSCDTDSKLSSSGQLSISSNKENTNGANDVGHSGIVTQLAIKQETSGSLEKEYTANSRNVFS